MPAAFGRAWESTSIFASMTGTLAAHARSNAAGMAPATWNLQSTSLPRDARLSEVISP